MTTTSEDRAATLPRSLNSHTDRSSGAGTHPGGENQVLVLTGLGPPTAGPAIENFRADDAANGPRFRRSPRLLVSISSLTARTIAR